MSRKLRIFGCVLIYFILAVGLAFLCYWKAVCPQGEHVWKFLYQGRAVAGAIGGDGYLLLYSAYLGLLYFLSAISIFWIGERLNRFRIGFLMGAVWFFLPVNWHLLFVEGELLKSLLIALLPLFFWNIYCYTEKEKNSAIVGATVLYFIFILCSVKYATVLLIAVLCYVLIYGIVRGKIKTAFYFLPALLIPYLLNGFWLCAYLKIYGTVLPVNAGKAAYYQKIVQTLNPFEMGTGGKDAWYLGIVFFLVLFLGVFFSHRNCASFFMTGMLLLFMTTTVFSVAAMNLPGLKNVDMTLLFPVIVCLAGVGILLWETLRKSLVIVAFVLMYVEAFFTIAAYVPDFFSQTAEKAIEAKAETMLLKEACELTGQRMAVFAGEEETSFAAYFVAESEKEISVTQGVDFNKTFIPNYIGQLEQARADGKYLYLFDRCLELGNDTVLIEKSRLQDGETDIKKISSSAEKIGYILKDENEAYLLYHMKSKGQFGVVSEYDAIGIGSSAGMLALEYPDIKETSSTNLNDYTYEELSKYKCVYLNGFTYEDKEAAEEMLIKLSENGVRIIIDAGGIPADIVSKNREFFGVTCNDISFEKGFPILYTKTDEYDCNLFAKNHEEWKTVYLTGLEEELGYFYENENKIDFMGTVKNDNIIFIALNLGYHYALTGDPMVEEIYDGLFDMTDEVLPERTIVPMKLVSSEKHITIETETALNTTIPFEDDFYSEQKIKESNRLLCVEAGTTVIEKRPVYVGAGLFLVFVGIVLAVPYYVFIFSRAKTGKVLE